jgi:hypothetical protein
MKDMVSITKNNVRCIFSISSPTAPSSNEELHQTYLAMSGWDSSVSALAGHSFCATWNSGIYFDDPQ